MRFKVRAEGRQVGAIGIFYMLPDLEVDAPDRESAESVAREEWGKTYEHVHIRSIREIEEGEKR